MMSIYPTARVKLSFVEFSLLCYEFCQKQNVRAFIIILGVTLKAVAFESYSEINGFVQIFFRDQFFLILLFILFYYLFFI